MFIYYDYMRFNSNFKSDVVHYSDYDILLIKKLHMLLNPLAFQFIS